MPRCPKDSKYKNRIVQKVKSVIGGGMDLCRIEMVGQLAGQNERAKRISFSFLLMRRRRSFGNRVAIAEMEPPVLGVICLSCFGGKSKHVYCEGTGFFCTLYFIVDGKISFITEKWYD